MMQGPSVTFVVMAGGKGERLWPLVRSHTPKVCLSPDGTRSLLQMTIDRLRPAWPGAAWLIVTTQEQAAPVRAGLTRSMRRTVLVEPQIKNTAACITLAAAVLAARNPNQVMVVVPADHWVDDPRAFQRAVRVAIRASVAHQTIAMIGIRPTHPHAGLGYLCGGLPLAGSWHPRVFQLVRFIEKPSRSVAQQLIRRPRTYWNSGVFVGAAETFLEGVTQWLPDHARRLVVLAGAVGTRSFARRSHAAYRALKAVSFDHGVMDHWQRGLIVDGRFRWADLGSWDAWARLGRAGARTVAVESDNVAVVAHDHHLVAAIGVRDLVVVHTPSVTLICRAHKAQAVRALVQRVARDPRLKPYR